VCSDPCAYIKQQQRTVFYPKYGPFLIHVLDNNKQKIITENPMTVNRITIYYTISTQNSLKRRKK
jgi:hypothetical protein